MLKATRVLLVGVIATVLGLMALTAIAQEQPAPGEGGILIEGNAGGDPATFNILLAGDTTSARITGFLFPGLIGVDPTTATFVKNDPGALVTDWTISEDGLVYTYTLRTDWTWTDGTPITSADVAYAWGAITSGVVDTPFSYLVDIIESVETPTADSYVVTFKQFDCNALAYSSLPIVPSHVMPADFADINEAEYNLAPDVTGGLMTFNEWRPGEQVSLLGNQSFGGAPEGFLLEGYVYKSVADQQVLVEQFLAGETNVIDTPQVGRRAEVRAFADAGSAQVYSFPGNAWDYIAMNYADPTNAQNAKDDAGNLIDQGKHPIFSDLAVRKAVSHAINVDELIEGAVFNEGSRMNAFLIPASWAYPQDLPFIEYNPDLSAQLLEEAGWVDSDGDGVREKDGVKLAFTLYTNEGNSRRETIGALADDALTAIGFEVDFQAIDFNTLVDILNNQTFDAVILGWRNGYPDDPDQTSLFTSAGDVVGGGNNTTSYYNEEVEQLMKDAAGVPGCDTAARAEIYAQIQTILQDELPYVPLFVQNGFYGAAANVDGFSPYPSQLFWNVDRWIVRSN